jgi:DNA-binding response OmpR family regulator
MDDLHKDASLIRLQGPTPPVVVDVREHGGIEAAVQSALQTAGLRQDMVAIVLVPFGAMLPTWPTRVADRGPRDAGDGLVIDALAHEVLLHGEFVPLTVREFALLHYLYERRGVVITREELLRDVWGERYVGGPRTIDIHIRRLRAKLGPQWFETTRGVGYKFRRSS